jgi:hypothetical protein
LFAQYFFCLLSTSFVCSGLLSFLPLNNSSFQPYTLLLIYTFVTAFVSL